MGEYDRRGMDGVRGKPGDVELTLGSILNHLVFIGHYRGQPIQQPIKMA